MDGPQYVWASQQVFDHPCDNISFNTSIYLEFPTLKPVLIVSTSSTAPLRRAWLKFLSACYELVMNSNRLLPQLSFQALQVLFTEPFSLSCSPATGHHGSHLFDFM